MAYTRDDRLLRYQAHALHGGVGGERVWLGLGSWLVRDEPARMREQIALAREVDAARASCSSRTTRWPRSPTSLDALEQA